MQIKPQRNTNSHSLDGYHPKNQMIISVVKEVGKLKPSYITCEEILLYRGFPHSSVGKESTCSAGDPGDSWVRKICWRRDRLPTPLFLGFPCGSAGKESACNAGDLRLIPGMGRSPGKGKGYPFQYSGLENSMDCVVHGVAKSWAWLSNFHFQ